MSETVENRQPLLEVKNLSQHFRLSRTHTVKAVNHVSFCIYPGEVYGLVGESGSGKSTVARAISRLYEPTEGEILFHGKCISGHLGREERKLLRTKMQMIFQDPMSSLNPSKKVMDIVAEGPDIFHLYKTRAEREAAVLETLKQVGLAPETASRYPSQFSGGQRQRIGIARALIMQPDLILADEPIASLDTSIQAQIINLLKEIKGKTNTAYLFIAHDLSMVKYISDRIGVMHKGYLVEWGSKEEIFQNPVHPYTRSLLASVPVPNPLQRGMHSSEDSLEIPDPESYAQGHAVHIEGTHYVWGAPNKYLNY